MKNTVVPTTKKLLGALAIIGLMSVVLAKFFSDLAFADDSQYLGEYEVTTVTGNDGANSCLQDASSQSHSIDPNCGKKVFVYRSEDGTLVLLNAVDTDIVFAPSVIAPSLATETRGGTIGKIVTTQVQADETSVLTPVAPATTE